MNITLVSLFIVLFFFFIVIESVRRGILDTKYSIVWIITCVILGVLSISTRLLEFLASLLGVDYAPSLLFLFGLLCTIVMIFDLTRRISNLTNKTTLLTQEYALLKEEHRAEIEQLTLLIEQKEDKK